MVGYLDEEIVGVYVVATRIVHGYDGTGHLIALELEVPMARFHEI